MISFVFWSFIRSLPSTRSHRIHVSYNTESRNPEEYDPYWFGSTFALHNGYIYMVDEDDMNIDEITDAYCWFRSKHMSYRIIPDE